MNLDALNSKEFQEDLADTISKINEKYQLSIRCGQITCGPDFLTIYVDDNES